jgi:hypothetical protein
MLLFIYRESKCNVFLRSWKFSVSLLVLRLAGFEADKKNILGHLLDRKVWRCPLVSIVGPGGLGKTTVPQKVYSEVCMYFQVAYCRCTTDVLCIYESL